jgi:hypothetical protein
MVNDGLDGCFIVATVTEKAILFIVVLVVEMNRYEFSVNRMFTEDITSLSAHLAKDILLN